MTARSLVIVTLVSACAASHQRTFTGDDAGSIRDAGPALDAAMDRTPIVDISAGYLRTCVLRESGNVVCWAGSIEHGLMPPQTVDGLSHAVDLDVSSADEVCIRDDSGAVVCAFASPDGALRATFEEHGLAPGRVDLPEAATDMAVGWAHACVVLASGRAACWGKNDDGELGDGTRTDRFRPDYVVGLDAVREIDVGLDSTCALGADGLVRCWGASMPVCTSDRFCRESVAGEPLADVASVEHMSIDDEQGALLFAMGGVRGWWTGRLGLSTQLIDSGAVRVAAGQLFACAVMAVGTIRCWGTTLSGNLGDGITREEPMRPIEPVVVVGIEHARAVDVSVEPAHACAVEETGQVSCWGSNRVFQLGDGTNVDRAVPVVVVGL